MKYMMIEIKTFIKSNIVKSRLTPYLLLVDYIDYHRMQMCWNILLLFNVLLILFGVSFTFNEKLFKKLITGKSLPLSAVDIVNKHINFG